MRIAAPRRSLFLILLLSLTVPAAAWAQNHSSSPFTDDPLWEFGVWGGEAFGKTLGQAFGETQITMAGFHIGRVIHEYGGPLGNSHSLEYTVDLEPLFLVTRPQTVYGGGLAPIGLKWNFAPRRRYRPYLEFSGGSMFTQKNVPPGNTENFNFTLSAGPGVMIPVRNHQVLSIGLRYWHLSNGGIGYNNPAFNTVQVVIGYHWLEGQRRPRQQLSQEPDGTQTKE
jgi:hypothetical protein